MKRDHLAALLLAAACSGSADAPAPAAEPAAKPSLFEEGTPTVPRPETSAPVAAGTIRFEDATATGIEAVHHAGRHDDRWIPEVMGGGIALVDVDRNGAPDVLFVDSGDLAAPSDDTGPRLWLNDGKGAFSEATADWGLTARGYGMGVAAGDVDGDGWVDVYLTSYDATDRLLRNDGGKGFVDVTKTWGVDPQGWSTSAAFLDADRDGDLDLYVVRYIRYSKERAIKCWYRRIHIYCTPTMYEALPDRLLRNDGGHFTDVSTASGVAAYAAKGLAITTGDLDDDGDVDVYVANDTSRNLLWLAQGDGTFVDAAVTAGVAYSELGREEASMGVSVSDADADGRWDLAVTNFQTEATSLYARRERGNYRERSDAAGIGASSRARLSFGIEWLDADNDGDEDLLVANGHINDNVATFRERVTFGQADSLYERVADGKFVDVSERSGPPLAFEGVSRGLAVGDLDGDGGLDYVVVDNDGAVRVVRNATATRGHWLSLWLEGAEHRSAIGATVTLNAGGRSQRREVRGASSYLSVSDRRLHFGLGDATAVESLQIRWPDGREQSVTVDAVDRFLFVREGSAPVAYEPGAGTIAP